MRMWLACALSDAITGVQRPDHNQMTDCEIVLEQHGGGGELCGCA